eukprot:TRINITY_DN7090_c0_g3_i1.p2 TRINITY_DN7090_c0_g3~~TRINITY_DN7090_c0_g3_i1.p2  ORF type:complete len:282 (+),score=112.30 TRINITY_DN7090_c0_g3_i1:63-908(+)
MRTFIFFGLVAVAAANQCAKSVTKSATELSSAATEMRVVVTACQNGTQADCLTGVKGVSTALNTLMGQVAVTETACNSSATTCAGNNVAATGYVQSAVESISLATKDCASNSTQDDCVVAVMEASSALGHAAANVTLAKSACSSELQSITSCVGSVIKTISDVKQAVADIKTSVKACKSVGKKNCKADVVAAVESVGAVLLQGTTAAGDCGLLKISQCVSDIEGAVTHLTAAVNDVKEAKTKCAHGIFNIKCLKVLIETASETAFAVMDVALATISCNPAV